eukprot:725392-Hanusia_phi.AAC.1
MSNSPTSLCNLLEANRAQQYGTPVLPYASRQHGEQQLERRTRPEQLPVLRCLHTAIVSFMNQCGRDTAESLSVLHRCSVPLDHPGPVLVDLEHGVGSAEVEDL